MIDIIPNWHPVFVHFTVALLVTASVLQLIVVFVGDTSLATQWSLVAKWNLWLGAGFVVITIITGVIAYNSVAHDTPSHLAMIEHRNWALVTAAAFLIVGIWSVL